jgi:hypothetical protein
VGIARFLGQSVLDGRAVRPEAVSVRRVAGGERGDGRVETAARQGPTVRLLIRLDGGGTLAAAMSAIDHPKAGERVAVAIDPAGVLELP